MTMIRSELTVDPSWPFDTTTRMNRMYRYQRHIYDITRRYYLLGRNELINGLAPRADAHVLEIGCGTGRNLIKAAENYPDAKLFGIDISAEMLDTARRAAERAEQAAQQSDELGTRPRDPEY